MSNIRALPRFRVILSRPLPLLSALALAALLQACGMTGGGRSSGPAPSSPAPGSSQSPASGAQDSATSRPDKGKGPPSRIADKAINITGNCSQTEEDGYREQATLNVKDNQMLAMSWQLWVGKKGTCTFEMADFRQTKSRPSIEMVSRDGSACKLVVYQDPRRVTLGFAECQKHCTGKIYDEAYPVMFDPRTGGCADLNR